DEQFRSQTTRELGALPRWWPLFEKVLVLGMIGVIINMLTFFGQKADAYFIHVNCIEEFEQRTGYYIFYRKFSHLQHIGKHFRKPFGASEANLDFIHIILFQEENDMFN